MRRGGPARVLFGGAKPLPPPLLYIGTQSADALLLSTAYTTYGLYAVQAASLSALELVLVGTAALGEVCGGPLLGFVGTLHTVRTALACAAVVLCPVLPLYGRCLHQRKPPTAETAL